jgi:hypothetical protein
MSMRMTGRHIAIAAGLMIVVGITVWLLIPVPVAVETAAVTKRRFAASVDEDGKTRVRERYVVAAPLAGRLSRIRFKVGDQVQIDDAVATIIPITADGSPDPPRSRGNDAPALAAADIGVALGARGASASSEAADVVILTDRLDRVGEGIIIAQRARRIALQSIIVGMGLSLAAMVAATIGWLDPLPAAIVQEVIDVAVILNALRALTPARAKAGRRITAAQGVALHHDHQVLFRDLDRIRNIVDAIDDAMPDTAAALIAEAHRLVQSSVVMHEREDEGSIYPQLAEVLRERHGLSAMSRAHREILHLARLLDRIAEDLPSEKIDRYLIRDAQRVIEAIETLVRMHTAQEEDIYEAVAA